MVRSVHMFGSNGDPLCLHVAFKLPCLPANCDIFTTVRPISIETKAFVSFQAIGNSFVSPGFERR